MKESQPYRPDESSKLFKDEMTQTDLDQVVGGFDPQPEPPAAMQKGSPNPFVKKVQKGLPHLSGDPIGA